MNWIDLLLWGIIILSIMAGFRRGLVRQTFDLAAVIVALGAAFYVSPRVVILLDDTFKLSQLLQSSFPKGLSAESLSHLLLSVLSFVLVYQICKLSIVLLGGIVGQLAEVPFISTINRLGGAGFGLLKGVLIAFLVISIASLFPGEVLPSAYLESTAVQEIASMSPFFYGKLQNMLADVLQYLPKQGVISLICPP